jgi:thiamine-phosphate pyrophosphorylase
VSRAPEALDPAAAGCQLLLISPPALDPAAFAPELDAALAAGGSAAFLLRLANSEREEIVRAAAQLQPVCGARGVAFLLQDDVDLALELGADGVHLGAAGPVAAARAALGAERILGASCGRSREAAVVAGEAGADYIAFGAPGRPPDAPPDAAVVELVEWWSELFVLPCLIDGDTALADCPALARAGADFIGVSGSVWQHPAGAAAAVADLRRAIART